MTGKVSGYRIPFAAGRSLRPENRYCQIRSRFKRSSFPCHQDEIIVTLGETIGINGAYARRCARYKRCAFRICIHVFLLILFIESLDVRFAIRIKKLFPALLCGDAVISMNLAEQTRKVLATLTPREEKVLRMRFGIGEKSDHTLEEVGQDFEVTRERIRQIEAKALRKLRHPSRSKRLKSFVEN